MTVSAEEAYQRMRAHHRQLQEELEGRVFGLWHALRARGEWTKPRADLVSDLEAEILPHARAEEAALYPACRELPALAPLVEAMQDEHQRLFELAKALSATAEGLEAGALARSFFELFALHVRKENDLLLPALRQAVDLGAVLAAMESALEEQAHVREAELDVRVVPHAERHRLIFGLLARLGPGQAFVLVNDHDPLPLRGAVEGTWPGHFSWTYLESGPEAWRVRIARRPDS